MILLAFLIFNLKVGSTSYPETSSYTTVTLRDRPKERKHMYFPWLPVLAALSIFTLACLLQKMFICTELIKTRLLSMPYHNSSKNVGLAKIRSVVQ